MKRYVISKELLKAIKAYQNSLIKLNKETGFEVKNLIYKNKSINENHLNVLESLFNRKFKLKRIYIDYGKNLRTKSLTKSINNIQRNGKLAEFIGIMLGDGNIWKNRVRIAFDKRNKKYIKYVGELFKEIFGIDLHKEIIQSSNQAYLYCTNLLVVEELFKAGLKRGNKIKNNVGIPIWIKDNKNYAKKCIRGLIDTDGCIYKCKRENSIYIKFTNFNLQLLGDFKEMTNLLDYSFAKANKNNWCLYRKAQVAKFIKDIKPLKSRGS